MYNYNPSIDFSIFTVGKQINGCHDNTNKILQNALKYS